MSATATYCYSVLYRRWRLCCAGIGTPGSGRSRRHQLAHPGSPAPVECAGRGSLFRQRCIYAPARQQSRARQQDGDRCRQFSTHTSAASWTTRLLQLSQPAVRQRVLVALIRVPRYVRDVALRTTGVVAHPTTRATRTIIATPAGPRTAQVACYVISLSSSSR